MRFKEFLNETKSDESTIREFLTLLDLDASDFIIHDDLTVTANYDLDIGRFTRDIKRLPLKFKEINGDVWISNCNLETLIGLPTELNGSLTIINSKITDLKYCSKKLTAANSSLTIQNNKNLISLEGCPEEIPESFNLSDNHSLTSLKFGPRKVGRHYKVDTCDGLTSIDGIAEFVGKSLSLCNNRALKNLSGISKKLKHCGGVLDVSGNSFESSILGVILVKGITELQYKFGGKAKKAFDIIFKCRDENKDELECQDTLIDEGLYEYAKL